MNRSVNLKINIITALSILFFVFSCKNNFDVDLSDVEKCNVKIDRYEQALFSQDLNEERIKELQQNYPLFLGNLPLEDNQKQQLENYVKDPYLQKIYDETQKKFPDFNEENAKLSHAFEHIKYYFPSFQYPKIYSYISGSQEEAYYQDHIVIFSVDRYFGFGHESYNMAGIPKYIQAQMKPKYIERDIIDAIASFYIREPVADASIISHMIYQGKKIYFIKSMLPNITDEVLFAQTEHHLKWLEDKRKNLWRYYIENELLYQSDYETYKKFIADAPFTSVLGDDSAPKTGRWLGYHIVLSFMKNNELSLSEMIQLKGDQEFLNRSKYKP